MSEHAKGLNDIAWEKLFEKYEILSQIDEQGQFIISASAIREYREPRLMAKFDHSINLPQIFSKHGLSILPISRGDYLISHFEAYHQFETPVEAVTRVSLPAYIQSIDPGSIPSEAVAINCALSSGILSDFLGEQPLCATVSGRMGSGKFSFGIRDLSSGNIREVMVNNAQIEIDAALEGPNSLAILEAKRDISADFLVRQLYYPFRAWQDRIPKRVRPIFLIYSNGIYHLYEYEFQNTGWYHSLKLLQQKNYSVEDTGISWEDLLTVKSQIYEFVAEPEISFPQADSFQRVINICELLSSQELSREEITENYAFNIRQTNYYTDAGRYLGLVQKRYENRKPIYSLSERGKKIMRLGYKQRQIALCKCILEHEVFYKAFSLSRSNYLLPKQQIVSIMKSVRLYQVESDSTYYRRASTISGWISWMQNLMRRNSENENLTFYEMN